MQKPYFLRFVAGLSEYFREENWLTESNIDAVFRDVKGIPDAALDAIASFIRSNYQSWPKSFSAAVHRGYASVERELAMERAKQEQKPPLTPEQHQKNQEAARHWIPKILAMNAANKPAYLNARSDEPGLRRQRGSR